MRKSVIALALFLSACVSMPPPPPGHGVEGISDRLFCGRSIPNGGEVTDEDIEEFLAEVVIPRFPDGFTSWTAVGNWRGQEERTLVLEFIHPYGQRYDDAVRAIAEEYRERFEQESVMRVSTPAFMEFTEE